VFSAERGRGNAEFFGRPEAGCSSRPENHPGFARRANRITESASASTTIQSDLEIKFAGQTAQYKQVSFQLVTQGNEIHLTGTIPATLADFKIDPPTLLTLPVKNEMPVRVDLTWRPQ
jgi:hypothetical protein